MEVIETNCYSLYVCVLGKQIKFLNVCCNNIASNVSCQKKADYLLSLKEKAPKKDISMRYV